MIAPQIGVAADVPELVDELPYDPDLENVVNHKLRMDHIA